MALSIEDRRPLPAESPVCAVDSMPLFPTIVGPRCPLCGGSSPRP